MAKNHTAKGVNIATEFDEFKDILFNKKIIRHKMRRIQSKKHKLGTYGISKISLSCFDNKRCMFDDGIHTFAYFHKDSRKQIFTNKKSKKKKSQTKMVQVWVEWDTGGIGN